MAGIQPLVLALAAAAALSACAKKEEVVYIEPASIPAEPTYSKY